jgi:hypothetical protein
MSEQGTDWIVFGAGFILAVVGALVLKETTGVVAAIGLAAVWTGGGMQAISAPQEVINTLRTDSERA